MQEILESITINLPKSILKQLKEDADKNCLPTAVRLRQLILKKVYGYRGKMLHEST